MDEKLLDWLNGDTDALQLCGALLYVAHLWDDLIDKDKERTDEEINHAFQAILAEMTRNRFYTEHSQQLAPLIASAALQYPIANKLERGSDGEKIMAFAMRNALLHIVPHCFFLIGGLAHYNQCAEEYYRYTATDLRGLFSTFWKEMTHA